MALPVSWYLREYWNSQKLSLHLKYFNANLRLFFIFLAEAQGRRDNFEKSFTFIGLKGSLLY